MENSGLFNNWTDREIAQEERKKNGLVRERGKNEKEIERLTEIVKSAGFGSEKGDEAFKQIEALRARNEEIEKDLNTVTVHTDESQGTVPYEQTETEEELFQEIPIGGHTAHATVDKPGPANPAETVAEGASATIREASDDITTTNTESADLTRIDHPIKYPVNYSVDDPETWDKAPDSSHDRAIKSAENKKGLETMIAGKETLLTFTAIGLNSAIYSHLCASALKKAVIVTSVTGLGKLDQRVDGEPLITKTPDGALCYDKKWPVKVVDDVILPNVTGSGSPVIIGDLNVLKRFVVRDNKVVTDVSTWNRVAYADREIKEEIFALTSNDDAVYIVGYLADAE